MTNEPPMQRASDFDPEVLLIFDQYVHGDIDRRTFLARVGKFAVGTVTAAGLLGALSPRFAEAQQIAPTDFHNPHGNLSKRHGHFEQIVKQGEFAQ